jgi:hypothetical protein
LCVVGKFFIASRLQNSFYREASRKTALRGPTRSSDRPNFWRGTVANGERRTANSRTAEQTRAAWQLPIASFILTPSWKHTVKHRVEARSDCIRARALRRVLLFHTHLIPSWRGCPGAWYVTWRHDVRLSFVGRSSSELAASLGQRGSLVQQLQ